MFGDFHCIKQYKIAFKQAYSHLYTINFQVWLGLTTGDME